MVYNYAISVVGGPQRLVVRTWRSVMGQRELVVASLLVKGTKDAVKGGKP